MRKSQGNFVSTTLASPLSSNGPTSLGMPDTGKLWIAPIPGAAGVVVDIPRRYVPLPGRVPKRSPRVDRQAHQREHRDDSGNRYLRARPERFRQSEIEGREIHQKRNDIGHEARSERMAAPPSRRRADDDRISDDDAAVGEVQRALLSIAQRKYESA